MQDMLRTTVQGHNVPHDTLALWPLSAEASWQITYCHVSRYKRKETFRRTLPTGFQNLLRRRHALCLQPSGADSVSWLWLLGLQSHLRTVHMTAAAAACNPGHQGGPWWQPQPGAAPEPNNTDPAAAPLHHFAKPGRRCSSCQGHETNSNTRQALYCLWQQHVTPPTCNASR